MVDRSPDLETWGARAQAAFEEAGFERVSVKPSNVTCSPYPYVYVYLSDRGIEGPHALVSQVEEMHEGDGLWVGVWKDLDEFYDIGCPDEVPTLEAAIKYVQTRMGERG